MKLNSEAKRIYNQITGEIKKRIILKESLAYLEHFSPTNDKGEILKRQAYLKENLKLVKPEMRNLLLKIKPIRFRKNFLYDRLLVVDESELEKAQALGVCEVSTEPLEGYDLILSTFDVDLSVGDIAPELYIMPLWENRETLEALARIESLLGKEVSREKSLRVLKSLMK